MLAQKWLRRRRRALTSSGPNDFAKLCVFVSLRDISFWKSAGTRQGAKSPRKTKGENYFLISLSSNIPMTDPARKRIHRDTSEY